MLGWDLDDVVMVPLGLYERLITAGLKARLLRFDPAATRISTRGLDPAEAHATLARHVDDVVARALRGIPQDDRLAKQAEVANEIIRLLSGTAKAVPYESHAEVVAAARNLMERTDPSTAGLWPRATALLARQALESALDDFWKVREQCSMKAQLLCLPYYLQAPSPKSQADDLAQRVSYAWAGLSRACHQHPYELPPTCPPSCPP